MATNLTGLTDKALVSRAPTVYKRREGWSDVAVEALDELRQRHGEDKMTWKQFRDVLLTSCLTFSLCALMVADITCV